LIIEKANGEVIDLDDTPIVLRFFKKSSLYHLAETGELEGRDGVIPLGTNYGYRQLSATFYFEGHDVYDYYLILNEVHKIFSSKEPYYIIHKKEPIKRWRVQPKSVFVPEEIGNIGLFEISFNSFLPYAESINKVEYKHTSNFSFNNIGDVAIEMVEQTETEIEFVGTSDNLTIRNTTTGDEWRYNGTTTGNDVILLKGVRSTKNGVSIFGNTNKKLLTFAPGWNDIEIEGATDYSITIRTRFYYI
jgi:phage-related protein